MRTGLWEFPSVPLEADTAVSASQAALEAHLFQLPGVDASLKDLPRAWGRQQHRCSHVFSHIQLTMTVHRLTVQVTSCALLCQLCLQPACLKAAANHRAHNSG